MSLAPELVWLEELLFEDSIIPLSTLAKFHPLVRIPVLAYQAADIVGTTAGTSKIITSGTA